MPARYIQAIFKQYHLFSKNKEAQEAAAAEDMMEELEDGSMSGGGPAVNNRNNNDDKNDPAKLKAKQEAIRKMQERIANGNKDDVL